MLVGEPVQPRVENPCECGHSQGDHWYSVERDGSHTYHSCGSPRCLCNYYTPKRLAGFIDGAGI